MRLSVIIPTIGRDTLTRALKSCAAADEIVLVADEHAGPVLLPSLPDNVLLLHVHGGDNGYTARTKGMAAATGTHLAFLDDDDVYVDGAIDVMRAAACDMPVIFRMDHPQHGILWRDPQLRFGNVGTPMFLVPNDPAKLGVWAAHDPTLREPGGDYTFITGCVDNLGPPVWREEVVARIRPPDGPTISVVTPWWNHPELAADYLAAIQAGRPEEVLIIDNASDEPIPFAAIRMDTNAGFSGASNVGLNEATCDAVLFLNNDIRMTSSTWLTAIREAVEPRVLVGARIRYDRHGDIDGVRLPYLDGWCLAGIRDDLLELGGWDQEYLEPSYYGDNDLCLRARAAGMTLREIRCGLHHKEGRTSLPESNPEIARVSVANKARFAGRAREILGMADRPDSSRVVIHPQS